MYIVIVNSYSGKRRYKKINNMLTQYMNSSFVTYFSNQYQGDGMWRDIDQFMNDPKNEVKGFIIIGGDGTLHHVVQHLHSYNLPFGLIPTGSGNDFGRALNISKNTKKAIARINDNKVTPYDMIEVNDEKVLSIIGIGVDAETAIACQHSRIKRLLNRAFLGRLTYLAVFFKTVFHYKPKQVQVVDENGTKYQFQRVWLLAAGNTSYYGGGIPICPKADPTDARIDLVIVHGLNLFQLFCALPTVFIKRHLTLPYITMLVGSKFIVTSSDNESLAVQGDGEEIGVTPATIKIVPKSILFY